MGVIIQYILIFLIGQFLIPVKSMILEHEVLNQNINENSNASYDKIPYNRTRRAPDAFCKISIQSLTLNSPLLINPDDHTEFKYPDTKDGLIYIKSKSPVHLACSGPGNMIIKTQNRFLTAQCTPTFKIQDYECAEMPKYTVKEFSMNDHTHIYKVGFIVDEQGTFLTLYTAYVGENGFSEYVRSTIVKEQNARTRLSLPSGFDEILPHKDLPRLSFVYSAKSQKQSFQLQLKSETDPATAYINVNRKLQFNHGHLTQKSSMVYVAAAAATNTYLNVAPQWLRINSGNWKSLENYIYAMVRYFQHDLEIVTGVEGQLSLRDYATGNSKDMFLYAHFENARMETALPIPAHFWKLVYSYEIAKGIVFVSSNHPQALNLGVKHLCRHPNFSEKSIINWNGKNVDEGYSYYCTVRDFLSTTQIDIQNFEPQRISSLLLKPPKMNNF